ncbi:MAG: TIM barrel protein [Candidatus Omnitrophica bacterium]|nr:TIM barrel protein [Candidatus Omnitrophota bacterium]
MDKTKVMDEKDILEFKIKDAIIENDSQRDLSRLSKNLAIMKNIFNISLTRDDYRYYKAHEGEFAIGNYQRFIRDNAPRYHVNAVLWPNIDKIDRYREEISKFYEYSFKRDEAFLKNIRFEIACPPADRQAAGRQASSPSAPRNDEVVIASETKQSSAIRTTIDKPRTSILIIGGFHTDNLCDMFKKEGISYITILPNFANDTGYESPYFTLLSGREKGIVEKLSAIIASAMLPIPERLIGSKEIRTALSEVLSENDVTALKAAVYIQSLIFEDKEVHITGEGIAGEGLVFGAGEGKVVEYMTVKDLIARVNQPAIAMAPVVTPAAAFVVTPTEIINIVNSWKYADPNGAEIRYALDEKTILRVFDIVKNRSGTIKGNPDILAKLCLIYVHSNPEDAEKNVEDWLNAYSKPYVFTAPKADEIRRPPVEGLSWSAFFDFMNPKVRDVSSLSFVPYLEYAIKEGIRNVEIPFDFLPFGFAARMGEEISDAEINDIKKICEEHGLTITIHSPLVGPLNDKTQYKQLFEDPADNISMMQKQIETAGRMGAKMMVVHLSSPEKIDEYAGLVLYARVNAPDLKIVFENYQDKNKVFPSAEDFMKTFTGIVERVAAQDKVALSNIGIVVDTAHYNLTGREDPIVSSFIIATRVKVLAAKYGIEAKDLLVELHVNQNIGPISFYGRGFSADIHAEASLKGPINNLGIISMLDLMGYRPHVTLEQMNLPTDGDMRLLDSARTLVKGKSFAEIEAAGNAIMAMKDYKTFLMTQIADPSMLDEAYKAYRILAGLIGRQAFEVHVQQRIYQKILTVKSEAEFSSFKATLQKAGLMDTKLDSINTKKYAENEEIIKQGAIVDLNKSDLEVMYIILEGSANGKIVVTDRETGKPIVVDFEVNPGNFVGEMAVITNEHERAATIVSRANTVALVLTAAVIRDIRSLMPIFADLIKTYKDMRDDENEARMIEAAVEAVAPIVAISPELISFSKDDYPPEVYRTTISVGEGVVSIAEYNEDGIIIGTVRTLSAGESDTIIARVGEGTILLQSPDRVTETYSAGTYRTQVIVYSGFVSVQAYDENGAPIGTKVVLSTGQDASIMATITGVTSSTYQEELAAKGAAIRGIREPIAGPAIAGLVSSVPITDIKALNEIKNIIVDMPELRTKSMRDLIESIEANSANRDEVKSVLEVLRYIVGVIKDAKPVLRGLSPDGKKFIFIPISEKLCRLNLISLRGKFQKTWKAVRDELEDKYDMGGVSLVFYDGTLGAVDQKLSSLAADGANQANTVVYIDAMTNENIDNIKGEIDRAMETGKPAEGAAGIYQNIMKRAYTIKDTADANGGYLSIAGHVVFALGALELVNTAQGAENPIYFAQVMALMQKMSPSAENYSTDRDRFLNDFKRGDIVIKLPPISKIDIDGNMETYFATEIAASTSL